VRRFGITDNSGFVDVFVCEADVGRGNLLLFRKKVLIGPRCDLAPLLRRIIFVREAALGLRLDFQGVRLGAIGGGRPVDGGREFGLFAAKAT
jgi:hypothetical protein